VIVRRDGMVTLRLTKIEKPKPQYKLTAEIIKLIQEVRPLQKKIFFEFNKRFAKTPGVDPEKIMEALYDENPDLFKQVDALEKKREKEQFKIAYKEDFTSVKTKALKGDKNSWLKLLRWDVSFLEYKQLREIIYEESTKNNSSFLEEIGKIISKPRRFHAGLKIEKFTEFILNYNPEKSVDKNLKALDDYLLKLDSSGCIDEDDFVLPDRREVFRLLKK
jgi:hypothetical protein